VRLNLRLVPQTYTVQARTADLATPCFSRSLDPCGEEAELRRYMRKDALENGMLAQISALSFAALAAVACAVAFRLWRTSHTLASQAAARRAAELTQELAARDTEHNRRISRLEHDLKSPLGAILGFSTLLREVVHENLEGAPPTVLKSVNGIDQAARRMLQIIEAAADRSPQPDRQEAVIERNS
jgi:signal transduction histidine kinase